MPVSEQRFRELSLGDPQGRWELDCGKPRRKPTMTFAHNRIAEILGHLLRVQLGIRNYAVAVDSGLVRRAEGQFYIPDVMVIPLDLARRLFPDPHTWEVYDVPLPLVAEVWSPSTGGYDVETKLPHYQRRGDREIWYLHPRDRTLRVWRRHPGGSYSETLYTGGVVRPAFLPNVSIDLDELFGAL